MTNAFQKGFGLIELVAAVAVLGILVSLAAPSVADIIDARRLQVALHAVQSRLQQARSEAIKRNRPIAVSYLTRDDGSWAIGYRVATPCNPMQPDVSETDACTLDFGTAKTLTVMHSALFPSIALKVNRNTTRFEPVRGAAMGTNATIVLTSPRGAEGRVIVSNIGRIRLCSPNGTQGLARYSPC